MGSHTIGFHRAKKGAWKLEAYYVIVPTSTARGRKDSPKDDLNGHEVWPDSNVCAVERGSSPLKRCRQVTLSRSNRVTRMARLKLIYIIYYFYICFSPRRGRPSGNVLSLGSARLTVGRAEDRGQAQAANLKQNSLFDPPSLNQTFSTLLRNCFTGSKTATSRNIAAEISFFK
ncbi:hypothetical protein BJV77DRAFT_185304 [Russula vinacea]|nr:hypothetical protein BJV77DRAFT_185304 [Russula vinacea]